MDVIFNPSQGGGDPFAIEVGFFDTVLEIKEKIQKYHKIPILQQTLIFNGKILQDDSNVESAEILQDSQIQLLTNNNPQSDHQNSPVLESQLPDNNNNNNNNKIKINLKIKIKIASNNSEFPIEIDPDDSIHQLKQRILEIDAVGPINRVVLQSSGSATDLADQRSLRECEISDNAEIEVRLRPAAVATATATAAAVKNKLKVIVMPKCGTLKIPMEVNAMDNVGELKKELEKQQQKLQFNLPSEGFFFIYDQDVMDEDRSFRWHGVGQGDVIEIFNGNITGGT